MSKPSRKPRPAIHETQPLKGRVVAFGARAERRERSLRTLLGVVTVALVALAGTGAWMMHHGRLVYVEAPAAPAAPVAATLAPQPQASAKTGKQQPHDTLTVAATMAPTPASGKFEDIVLPASDKPSDKAAASDAQKTEPAPKAAIIAQPATQPKAETAKPAPVAPEAVAKAEAVITLKKAEAPVAKAVIAEAPKEAPKPMPAVTAAAQPVVQAAAPKVAEAKPAAQQVVQAQAPKPAPQASAKPAAQVSTKPVAVSAAKPAIEAKKPATAPKIAETKPAAVPAEKPAPKLVAASKPNPALDEAHAALEQENYAAALAVYDRILDRDSKNYAALSGKAYVLQRTEQPDAAIDIDHQLLKLNPADALVRANLIAALGQSSMPSSQTELQKLVTADPRNASAEAALGRVLARRGYFDQAYQHLNHAAQLEPNNLVFRLDLAILHDRWGHAPDAIALYQQVLTAENDRGGVDHLMTVSPDTIRARIAYLQQQTDASR